MMPEATTALAFQCTDCDYESDQDFKFCPKCGAKRIYQEHEPNPFKSKHLKSLLAYFFISMLFLIIYKVSEDHWIGLLEDVILVCTVLGVIDLVFALYNGKESFLFGFKNVKIKPMGLLLLGLVAFAFVVSFLADFLNQNLSDGYYFDAFAFGQPLWVVVVLQCIYPAVFEELAFRGFLINNLRALSNDRTAIGVSGFLFAIMHINFLGLLWLLPIGLLFGYLRIRYNTLWYGITGHFVYNFVITLIDNGSQF